MNPQTLSKNIRRFRIEKGMSQSALAKAAGVSSLSIKKIETAKTEPRVNTLLSIATSLNIKLSDLFFPVIEPKSVRFRSNKKMRNRENILAKIAVKLKDFNELQELLGDYIPYKFIELTDVVSTDADIIKIALKCRSLLKIGNLDPINDISGLLENAGIKVLSIQIHSDDFFGLSVSENDGGPAIVVNVSPKISIERQIFSSAHELGHLILHKNAFDVNRTEEDKLEEKQANIFASHFLMTDEGFKKEWSETYGSYWIDRVLKVKSIFNVSYKTVLYRLIDKGIVDETIWQKFKIDHNNRSSKRLGNKEEPLYEPCRLKEYHFFPNRFLRLVRKAIEEKSISVSRSAEMLNVTVDEMRTVIDSWRVINDFR